jgi:hypothetical protein
MSDLLTLAERCEREEPSDALDWAIAQATTPPGVRGWYQKPYTTSLDAAVTLVPEDWNWTVERYCFDAVMPYREPGAKASVWRDSRNPRERFFYIEAKTPALALCAAALRARAAMEHADE